VLRYKFEVIVRTQQREVVPYAQLRKQGIDCADLNSGSAAGVAKFSGGDMILPLWLKQRKRSKAFDDLSAGLGSGEALQQLLQHKPCRYNDIRSQ
jgi:hypothetical protein